MYGGIMLVPRERHKMKQKTDKTIDHQRHFVHFLWTSNRGQQVYDMGIVQLDFEEKTQFFKKKPEFWKKKPEFWKHLSSFKKSEFKKTLSFEKIWVFLKKLISKGKTWALTKENIVGMKIEPQT